MQEIQEYILLIIGLFLVGYGAFKKTKNRILLVTGVRAEGIVFRSEMEGFDSSNSSTYKTEILIRFMTEKKEWITEKISQDFAIFYNRQYKEGEKLTVYYNPNNPNEFFVDNKQSERLGRLLFIIVGLIILSLAVYKLIIVHSTEL